MSQGMVSINRRSPAFWAWTVSIAAHAVILLVFGVIKFSKAASFPNAIPAASISKIKELADSAAFIPKPAVKPAAGEKNPDRPGRIISSNITLEPGAKTSKSPVDLSLSSSMAILSSGVNSMEYQGVEFFGSRTESRKICYVVDCSGSMQGVFEQVKRNLKKTIEELQGDGFFYIIFFGNSRLYEYGDGRLVRASNSEKARACDFIDSIKPAGKTNALQALQRALEIRDSGNRRLPVIFFLTDGFELTSKEDRSSISDMIENTFAETGGVRVNTIGFWPRKNDREILEKIAAVSGGEAVFITTDEKRN